MNNSIETLNKITSRYGMIISHVDDLFRAVFDLILKNQIGTIEIPTEDQKTIFRAIKEYSDCGYIKATVDLVECYIFGFGTELDIEEGLLLLQRYDRHLKYLEKDPSLLCIIGYIDTLMEGFECEGEKLLKNAAEHGEARAYYFLGRYYYVEGNKSLAIKMYELALKNRFFSVWKPLFAVYNENGEGKKAENLFKGLVDRDDLPYHIDVEIGIFRSSMEKFLESVDNE